MLRANSLAFWRLFLFWYNLYFSLFTYLFCFFFVFCLPLTLHICLRGPSLKNKRTHTLAAFTYLFLVSPTLYALRFLHFLDFWRAASSINSIWVRMEQELATDSTQPPALRVRRGLSKCCGRQWKHGPWEREQRWSTAEIESERESAEMRENINHPLAERVKKFPCWGNSYRPTVVEGGEKRKKQPVELPANWCCPRIFFSATRLMLSFMLTFTVLLTARTNIKL